jgi:hypothetical protein
MTPIRGNPKSEARNPKQSQTAKSECPSSSRPFLLDFSPSDFRAAVSDLEFASTAYELQCANKKRGPRLSG